MRVCPTEGCGRPFLARTWGSRHYTQWQKHGDPLARFQAERGAPLAWIEAHLHHQGDECLMWPFKARYGNGYPAVWFRGKLTGAHRVMCILAHGEPPFEAAEAAHSCGRGRDACLHPLHLRWATHAENFADRVKHGTSGAGEKNPQAKLTWVQVRIIRARPAEGETHLAIANDYGVDRKCVSMVVNNKTWREAAA